MEEEAKSAEAKVRNARHAESRAKAARDAAREAEKKAQDRTESAEERARVAEHRLEEALRKAKEELAAVRAEHTRYLDVALPAALEEARTQAMEDYTQSEDFESRLVTMYQDGMRDMKAGFTLANPSLVRVDWSFVPEDFEDELEEGELPGVSLPGDAIVLDEPEQHPSPEQPVQPPASEQPPSSE